MTVAEFSNLPKDDGPVYHELRHGEIVTVTRAKYGHYSIQRRTRRLMEALAPLDSLVDIEFAYRPLPEHELWVADVAYVSPSREKSIDPNGYLTGAPDIVIEVLSPSNTVEEIEQKKLVCLRSGTREFWVLDPKRRQIRVATPDGITRTYRSGDEVPLALFGDARIAVDAIFG